MIIDFNKLEEELREKPRGGEGLMAVKTFSDGQNRILYGTLKPGSHIGLHTHETDSETMYFLEGTGKILFEGEYLPVKAGLCHYCPKGKAHSLINDSSDDLVFFAVLPTQ